MNFRMRIRSILSPRFGATLDKVDSVDFRKAVATLGVTSYILADMAGTLPRGGSE